MCALPILIVDEVVVVPVDVVVVVCVCVCVPPAPVLILGVGPDVVPSYVAVPNNIELLLLVPGVLVDVVRVLRSSFGTVASGATTAF